MKTPDPQQESQPESLEPSRRELRELAEAYAELAEQLAKGKYSKLPDPPFDEPLREAIHDAQRFVKNARSRQIRRLAQLLRDAAPLAELCATLEGRGAADQAKQELERSSEAWRARLLQEGDSALSELVAAHPNADRQHLRQLIRQANRTPADPRAKRAATSLIRAIRALLG